MLGGSKIGVRGKIPGAHWLARLGNWLASNSVRDSVLKGSGERLKTPDADPGSHVHADMQGQTKHTQEGEHRHKICLEFVSKSDERNEKLNSTRHMRLILKPHYPSTFGCL